MNVIDEFKAYYRDFSNCDISDLENFYHPDIVFSDPIHQIQGVQQVKDYFSSICGDLIECRFEFLGETIDDHSAWFKWSMYYRHPKLRKGELLSLTGATVITFDDVDAERKIISHEDFYDMGSMLYEHTPILGSCVRWLKQQLTKTAAGVQ
jgi:hypothetical protein